MTKKQWMAVMVIALACGCDGGTEERVPTPLPGAECAPACGVEGPVGPPGYMDESTCYDGCNWCQCTTDGPMNCTARLCSDAGL